MDWRPNQDAVRFFLHRIYPEIKKAEPRTSVVIAGREPPTDLKTMMTAYKDVLLVGTVPDMRPYLASAAVYIVPLRIGGGTRLKILEAMAMGRPVVSTSVGCEGLAVAPGCDLLVADQPEAFAQAVLRLFRDPALADQVGRAGHDLVKKEYGWEQIANGLDAAWQAAAFAGGNRLCAGSPVY
jgi:glycosyltransferase involved in cell wall biosynthesis